MESTELIGVEENVQTIKRALVKFEREATRSKEQGDLFDSHVEAIMKTNKVITIIHVVMLLAFGGLWVYLVKKLKRSK